MLQRGGHLTRPGAPHHHGAVRGAAEQVGATCAEAAAVHPVTVTGQRGVGELREVLGVVKADGFVPGGGGQQRWREGAAAHLVCVMVESRKQRHHVGPEFQTKKHAQIYKNGAAT